MRGRIMKSKNRIGHYSGCLVGGAIGDALGWPVEFKRRNEIIKKYGDGGITDLISSTNGKAEITDDTQMTLFTAEGLLRAETRGREKGICHIPSVVYFAYKRWLHTQGHPKSNELEWIYDGWLLNVKELHQQRAPGNSCLSALLKEEQGTVEQPINNSKGCGGVMRVAPIGLCYQKEKAFQLAVECAALTHGHPSGYLSAGTLAYIVAAIIEGVDLEQAIIDAVSELGKHKDHEECSVLINKAIMLAKSDESSSNAITRLGEGWVGEEALAIAIYCALKYKNDFTTALIAAVNHDGDSDSTGSITGNILGAFMGLNQLPPRWIQQVELSNVLSQVADDLFVGYRDDHNWRERYPGH
jgi:ADP-ribosylglycohydrolase